MLIFGSAGSLLLCVGFLQSWGLLFTAERGRLTAWLLLSGSTGAGGQAQRLWLAGFFTPQHVGPSPTRDGACVPLH